MTFQLLFSTKAKEDMQALQSPHLLKRLKAVKKTLQFLETNPRHQSLNTHKYSNFWNMGDIQVFEAYAENKTPGAYRIFWRYGPGKDAITILAITPHP